MVWLPDEVLSQVLLRLTSYDALATVSCVDKRFHRMAAGKVLFAVTFCSAQSAHLTT